MTPRRLFGGGMLTAAVAGSAIIGAQYIAGKAARDAMFLAAFDASILPRMIIGTSIFSIGLVVASARTLARVQPSVWVPVAFAMSGLLFAVEWALTGAGPGLAASLLYLQVSGLGPMLGSGFWLIASERFDPRSARKTFGIIAGAGTIGGLLGGLGAARIVSATGIETLLPLLGIMNAICAWQVWAMGRRLPVSSARKAGGDDAGTASRSGLRVLASVPYLRNLALLVLLGTVAAVLIDYVFKVQVKTAFGRGPALGSFFSIYYAVISLLTFGVQTLASRAALEKLGLAVCASAPAAAIAVGGVFGAATPALPVIVAARGGEAVTRGSLFRAAYELFYTPMSPADKRVVKSVIDVGIDRCGDIVGATMVQLLLLLPLVQQPGAMLGVGVVCSLAALGVARRLTPGYVSTLEENLRNRAVDVELADVVDGTTRTVLLKTLYIPEGNRTSLADGGDRDVAAIQALRSGDAVRAARTLRSVNPLSPSLVSHVIPLLDADDVALDAIRALRLVADRHVGELTDALLDAEQPFAVRRRLARVFSTCASQRAADGLVLAFDDLRFEVRYQSARSLAAMRAAHPEISVNADRVLAVVQRELGVSRGVWEGRHTLESLPDDARPPALEALANQRANPGLAHVFILLSLVLPAEPVRIAFAGLQTTDAGLRGTALEYLDATLPPAIHDRLWPFLDPPSQPGAKGRAARPVRTREEIAAELLESRQSIQLNLNALDEEPGAAR